MAALEAKIQQYNRDLDHLKRALERSDRYIEELESQVRKSEKCLDVQEACGSSQAESDMLTQQQKIDMMMRSLSDTERQLICSNPETECPSFSRSHSLVFMPSADNKEFSQTRDQKNEHLEYNSDFLPTTPSSAFRSLTLRSPGIREKKVAFKPMSHLRRLHFEEFPSPRNSDGNMEDQFSSIDNFTIGLPPATTMDHSKSAFWGSWPRSNSNEESCPGPSNEGSIKQSTSTNPVVGTNSFEMSSEASMDAAYLDKISELDTMMLDGESSNSRGSQLSLAASSAIDLDNTVVPEPQTCPDVSSCHSGKAVLQCDQTNYPERDIMEATLNSKEPPKVSVEESFAATVAGRETGAHIVDCAGYEGAEELSFDLLFDPPEGNKAGPSSSLSPASQDHDSLNSPNSSFSSCTGRPVNTGERFSLNISQPIKRKSRSPFNISSPTKLSKLM